MWEVFKDESLSSLDKKATVLDFDKILGLGFSNLKEEIIPKEVSDLLKRRGESRSEKDFKKSDELRKEINNLGYEVKDTGDGQKVSKL